MAAPYHSKDTYFAYGTPGSEVVLTGATAAVVQSVTWPQDQAEHDVTPVGAGTEAFAQGLEKSVEIVLNCFYNALCHTALIAKKGTTGQSAILGPRGNTSGYQKFHADSNCYISKISNPYTVNNVEMVNVTIRIANASPNSPNVGTNVTTF